MLKIAEISTDLVTRRLSRALGRFIGRGQRFDYGEAADVIEADTRTVESWVRGERCAGLHHFLRLCRLPGAGVVIASDVLALAGLEAREITPRDAASAHVMAADLSAGLAELLRRLEDGRLDHREEAELRPVLLALNTKLASFCAALDLCLGRFSPGERK